MTVFVLCVAVAVILVKICSCIHNMIIDVWFPNIYSRQQTCVVSKGTEGGMTAWIFTFCNFATLSFWLWRYKRARLYHDDVIKWKHFPRYWPFVRGIHRSPVNSPHKGQWRRALMFSLICVWIKGWENNREAGDLRRYRAHYDVIVMITSVPSGIHDKQVEGDN